VEAWIPRSAAQWRQSVPETGCPGKRDSACALQAITLQSRKVTAGPTGRAD
jgi:hypothetical protein